jgi:hypothetical protein
MFSKDSFLAFRPEPKERFLALGIPFDCINLEEKTSSADPVIGAVDSKYSYKVREIFIINGFVKLSDEEVQEIGKLHLGKEMTTDEGAEGVFFWFGIILFGGGIVLYIANDHNPMFFVMIVMGLLGIIAPFIEEKKKQES